MSRVRLSIMINVLIVCKPSQKTYNVYSIMSVSIFYTEYEEPDDWYNFFTKEEKYDTFI